MQNGNDRAVLYPNHYTWFVLVSALDVMLTWIVLYFGGREANVIALAMLRRFGLPGLIVLKFGMVSFVVVLCEFIGRRNHRAGLRLIGISTAITCAPVLLAFFMLLKR
jgi:hypothetical protein